MTKAEEHRKCYVARRAAEALDHLIKAQHCLDKIKDKVSVDSPEYAISGSANYYAYQSQSSVQTIINRNKQ